jgi:hypothetical protein
MRILLIIPAAVFLVLVIVGAKVVGIATMNGNRLDASSRQYVDRVVPAILSEWSPRELIRHASAEFKEPATAEEIDQVFLKLSELGVLKHCEKATGNSRISFTTQDGRVVTADYTAHAAFSKGSALIKIRLMEHGGRWEIINFQVESPVSAVGLCNIEFDSSRRVNRPQVSRSSEPRALPMSL